MHLGADRRADGLRGARRRPSSRAHLVDWSRVHFWWGVTSGGQAATRSATTRLRASPSPTTSTCPTGNVHPFPASDLGMSLDEAADVTRAELGEHGVDGLEHPIFDIVFHSGLTATSRRCSRTAPGIQVTDRTVIPVRNGCCPSV